MLLDIKNVFDEIFNLAKISPSPVYQEAIDEIIKLGLVSNTLTMYGINEALFKNKLLLAKKLYQNSLYENYGGELIEKYAEQLATGKLKDDMMSQIKDEYKHSKVLAFLVSYTGVQVSDIQNDLSQNAKKETLPGFNNDIKIFICFTHAAEVRTLVMLAQYIDIIKKTNDPNLLKMLPMLERIMRDERQHAAYTSAYINEWMNEHAYLKQILIKSFHYTNVESWKEISSIANSFSELIPTKPHH